MEIGICLGRSDKQGQLGELACKLCACARLGSRHFVLRRFLEVCVSLFDLYFNPCTRSSATCKIKLEELFYKYIQCFVDGL